MTLPLDRLFPAGVAVASSAIEHGTDELFEEEAVAVHKAIPRRQREFATGRVLARRLLAGLGYPPRPIAAGADRAPRWPDGVIGSISHTEGICVVAVARRDPLAGVGVDVELLRELGTRHRRMICTPAECERLAALPEALRDAMTLVTFSAKEALYKCQYALSGQFLGFQDVELDLQRDPGGSGGRFVGHISRPEVRAAGLTQVAGSWLQTTTYLISGATCQKPASAM